MTKASVGCLLLLVGLGGHGVEASAFDGRTSPYHETLSGPLTKAHYVHLTLTLSPATEAKLRQEIRDSYNACKLGKDMVRRAGGDPGPVVPPPAAGALERLRSRDIDIYYGNGQTVTVLAESNFRINHVASGEGSSDQRARLADCSLREEKTKHLYLTRSATLCDVDLLAGKLRANGCPWTEQAGNPPDDSGRRIRRAAPGANALFDSTSGGKRTIAGHVCQLVDVMNGVMSRCFAYPASSFPIARAHFAGPQTGLLLLDEWHSRGETMTAATVQLEAEIPKAVFEMPQGVVLDNSPTGRKRQ